MPSDLKTQLEQSLKHTAIPINIQQQIKAEYLRDLEVAEKLLAKHVGPLHPVLIELHKLMDAQKGK